MSKGHERARSPSPSGDRTEAEAAPVPGRSTLAGSLEPATSPSPPLDGDAKISTRVVGHASPRWRRPGASTRDQRNLKLSRERAEVVQVELEALLGTGSNVRGEVDELGVAFETSARGSADTVGEAGGDLEADDEVYRRVDVAVDIERTERGVAHESTREKMQVWPLVYAPAQEWSVRVIATRSYHKGIGVIVLTAELTNRYNGAQAVCVFVGKGFGEGLGPRGDVAPRADLGGATSFRTKEPVTFVEFDGTVATYMETSANAGIGYGVGYLRFPLLSDEAIKLDGWEAGGLGAGASINEGSWHILQSPRDPGPREIESPATRVVPTATPVRTTLHHRVHFETGQSALSPLQRQLLSIFASSVVGSSRR